MIESLQNLHEVNAMLSDSDLLVLQNNYQFILWTILALGTIIITINIYENYCNNIII
jgi:hypothetical protein